MSVEKNRIVKRHEDSIKAAQSMIMVLGEALARQKQEMQVLHDAAKGLQSVKVNLTDEIKEVKIQARRESLELAEKAMVEKEEKERVSERLTATTKQVVQVQGQISNIQSELSYCAEEAKVLQEELEEVAQHDDEIVVEFSVPTEEMEELAFAHAKSLVSISVRHTVSVFDRCRVIHPISAN